MLRQVRVVIAYLQDFLRIHGAVVGTANHSGHVPSNSDLVLMGNGRHLLYAANNNKSIKTASQYAFLFYLYCTSAKRLIESLIEQLMFFWEKASLAAPKMAISATCKSSAP